MNGEMTAKLYAAGSLYEHPRAGGITVVLASDYDRLRDEVTALRESSYRVRTDQNREIEQLREAFAAASALFDDAGDGPIRVKMARWAAARAALAAAGRE
jgi:hypothetical protein